jgi:hypothetical protein
MRYNSQIFKNNTVFLMNRSVTCRITLTAAYVTTSRYSGAGITNNLIKTGVVIIVMEFEHFFFFFRYMAALEDTLNLPLCGVLLMLLTVMCFVSFSTVTVKY